jgi:alpha-acetolactate decarboxylase
MKLNEKKEKLLKELREVNYEVFVKVHDGECFHDITGNDHDYFKEAMRYVPNHVIKKWINNCKTELKEHERIENENPTRT